MAKGRTPPSAGARDLEEKLIKSALSRDLLAELERTGGQGPFRVILDFNERFPGGGKAARRLFFSLYARWIGDKDGLAAHQGAGLAEHYERIDLFQTGDRISVRNSLFTENFVFAELSRATIRTLAGARPAPRAKDDAPKAEAREPEPLIHKIWLDHEVSPCVFESARTIKCDAARAAFGSAGERIVWAVADTGVAGGHPHFKTHNTLWGLPEGVEHRDFTELYDDNERYPDERAAGVTSTTSRDAALTDAAGHGTHVAGIIAGESVALAHDGPATVPNDRRVATIRIGRSELRDEEPSPVTDISHTLISGIAPRCKILSLKVLKTKGAGNVASLIAALGYIQHLNAYGRDIKVHGLNLSLGYSFDPEWFAAGQSPLCQEVDRLVRCGVVVVAAAGNGGYGTVQVRKQAPEVAAHASTISDPGNAELAITVGSTHRDSPHRFGVSYFSAKGPTADGRLKPDLVAPGERIISCAPKCAEDGVAEFCESTGTSMAAPHVSGAAAAFLSSRREFIGRPEEVKDLFTRTATDLKRRPEFQGAGLLDLMRAFQAV